MLEYDELFRKSYLGDLFSLLVELCAIDNIGDEEDEDADKIVDESSVSVSSSMSQLSLLLIWIFGVFFWFNIFGAEMLDWLVQQLE